MTVKRIDGFLVELDWMILQSDGIDRRFQNSELFFGCGRDFKFEFCEDDVELVRGVFRGGAQPIAPAI